MTKRIFILTTVALAMIVAGIYMAYTVIVQPDPDPVIKDAGIDLNDTSKGMMRVKINPEMHIEKGRIRDLLFFSVNKGRYMKCRIRMDGAAEGDYLIETPFTAPGKVIESIALNTHGIDKGRNHGTAEIYTYMEKDDSTQIGQANVEIAIEK